MSSIIQGVGDFAFYGCSTLSDVDFGTSLSTIGNGAFAECIRLNHCTLKDNVGKGCFLKLPISDGF